MTDASPAPTLSAAHANPTEPPAPAPRSSQAKALQRKRRHKSQWYNQSQRQISKAQKRTLAERWPGLGKSYAAGSLTYGEPVDLEAWFGRAAPTRRTHLDIGFGYGDSLLTFAKQRPDVDFVGVEIHRASHAVVCDRILAEGLGNVRLLGGQALKLLERHIPSNAVDEAYLFFPDPFPTEPIETIDWEATRKLLTPAFLAELARVFRGPDPRLFVATDAPAYLPYVRAAVEVAGWRIVEETETSATALLVEGCQGAPPEPAPAPGRVDGLVSESETKAADARPNAAATPDGATRSHRRGPPTRPTWRPVTVYERKAIDAGSSVWDFTLAPPAAISGEAA